MPPIRFNKTKQEGKTKESRCQCTVVAQACVVVGSHGFVPVWRIKSESGCKPNVEICCLRQRKCLCILTCIWSTIIWNGHVLEEKKLKNKTVSQRPTECIGLHSRQTGSCMLWLQQGDSQHKTEAQVKIQVQVCQNQSKTTRRLLKHGHFTRKHRQNLWNSSFFLREGDIWWLGWRIWCPCSANYTQAKLRASAISN